MVDDDTERNGEEFRKGEDFKNARNLTFIHVEEEEKNTFWEIIIISFVSISKINQRQLKMKKIFIFNRSIPILIVFLYSNNSSQIDESTHKIYLQKKKKKNIKTKGG